MDKNYWIERWKKKEIGFHQENYNEYLQQYGEKFFRSIDSIFIPLCGKTKDILWFYHFNKNLLGVEISEIACCEFFVENKIPFNTQTYQNFKIYSSLDKKIYILNGDFFCLEKSILQIFPYKIHGIYDRAALIALPKTMRIEYVRKIHELFHPFALKYFLITLEYELFNKNTEEHGPPFCVRSEEIFTLYSSFKIQKIEERFIQTKNHIQCKEILFFMDKL